jgi:site-specific recombinase XerD
VKRVKFIPKFSKSRNLWILNIPPTLSKTGKRARLYFTDREKAFKAASRLKERNAKFGVSLSSLDPIRMGVSAECWKLLDAHAKSTGDSADLLAVVRGYLDQYRQRNVSKTLAECFDEYLANKQHLSTIHRSQIKSIRERFKALDIAVSDIQPHQLQSVLDPLAAGTKNRYIRILKAIFAYGIHKDYCKTNPAEKLSVTHLKKKPIQIFSNEAIEGMLRYSLDNALDFLPWVAIGAFAGLRVDSPEMTRLLWSDIHFEEKTIVVRKELAKTGKPRFVPISPNLEAWLKLYLERKGGKVPPRVIMLPPGTLRKVRWRVFKAVKSTLGVDMEWIPAGLRHGFASAFLNSGHGIDETCLALGHIGSPTMLFNNYHLAIQRARAEAYWQILP